MKQLILILVSSICLLTAASAQNFIVPIQDRSEVRYMSNGFSSSHQGWDFRTQNGALFVAPFEADVEFMRIRISSLGNYQINLKLSSTQFPDFAAIYAFEPFTTDPNEFFTQIKSLFNNITASDHPITLSSVYDSSSVMMSPPPSSLRPVDGTTLLQAIQSLGSGTNEYDVIGFTDGGVQSITIPKGAAVGKLLYSNPQQLNHAAHVDFGVQENGVRICPLPTLAPLEVQKAQSLFTIPNPSTGVTHTTCM